MTAWQLEAKDAVPFQRSPTQAFGAYKGVNALDRGLSAVSIQQQSLSHCFAASCRAGGLLNFGRACATGVRGFLFPTRRRV